MIRYALRCAAGHEFDSWFQSANAYDALAASGHLSCAVCGATDVRKSVMAPRIGGDSDDGAAAEPAPIDRPSNPAEAALAEYRRQFESQSTYVGQNFVTEARAMHLGEVPKRSIWGKATPDEARDLAEDGVPVAPLPFRPSRDSN